jgi:hypothetical protein
VLDSGGVSIAASTLRLSGGGISEERESQPESIEAERAISAGRAVWRVTFRGRLPGQPPLLFETIIVEVDRQSGEVVSIARS